MEWLSSALNLSALGQQADALVPFGSEGECWPDARAAPDSSYIRTLIALHVLNAPARVSNNRHRHLGHLFGVPVGRAVRSLTPEHPYSRAGRRSIRNVI